MEVEPPWWTLRPVEEAEFDTWLRELVLCTLYLAFNLTVAYVLGLLWRRQPPRHADLLRFCGDVATPPRLPARRTTWAHRLGFRQRRTTLMVDPERGAAAAPPPDAAPPVDVWSVPFHICVVAFAIALATALAVPVTLFTLTQLSVTGSTWVDGARMVNRLWEVLVKGSNALLFLGLPLAYFFHEADDASGRTVWRRFAAALCEVVLMATVCLGIFTIVQRTLVDPPSAPLAYPSTVISSAQTLPALVILMFTAPIGVLQLVLNLVDMVLPRAAARSQLAATIDAASMEASVLSTKLAALDAHLPALTASPPVSPTLTTEVSFPSTDLASFLGDGGSGPPGLSSAAPTFRRHERTLSFPDFDAVTPDFPSYRLRRRSLPDDFSTPLQACVPRLASSVPSKAFKPPRHAMMTSLLSRHAAPGIATDLLTRLRSTEDRRDEAAAELAKLPSNDSWTVRMLWLAVLLLVGFITTLSVFRSAARPILGLIVTPGTYSVADCSVDVLIILFYCWSALYGVYMPNALLPLPLYKWRPTLRDTPLSTLLANAVLLLLLSFSLPIVLWILGMGDARVMEMIAAHYGYITVLRYSTITWGYVLVMIVVMVWLAAVKAKRRLQYLTQEVWKQA